MMKIREKKGAAHFVLDGPVSLMLPFDEQGENGWASLSHRIVLKSGIELGNSYAIYKRERMAGVQKLPEYVLRRSMWMTVEEKINDEVLRVQTDFFPVDEKSIPDLHSYSARVAKALLEPWAPIDGQSVHEYVNQRHTIQLDNGMLVAGFARPINDVGWREEWAESLESISDCNRLAIGERFIDPLNGEYFTIENCEYDFLLQR